MVLLDQATPEALVKVGVEIVLGTKNSIDSAAVAEHIRNVIHENTPYTVIDIDGFDMEAEAAEFLRSSLKKKACSDDDSGDG